MKSEKLFYLLVMCTLAFGTLFAGCRRSNSEQLHYEYLRPFKNSDFALDPVKQTRLLRTMDAVKYARKEYRTGNTELLGIGGLVVAVPCIEQHSALIASLPVKVISGTGESTNAEFQSLATKFAYAYNWEMLRLLTTHGTIK